MARVADSVAEGDSEELRPDTAAAAAASSDHR